MADVKWIKLATDIFDNRKIRQIECLPDADTIIVIWIKLLCLAGTINDDGLVYFSREIPYTDQMLATELCRPLPTIQLALQTFERFGMIETTDNILCISNWEKYQNIEGLDRIREQTRKRVAKHRKQKQIADCNDECNVTVTHCNATEEEGEEEEEEELHSFIRGDEADDIDDLPGLSTDLSPKERVKRTYMGGTLGQDVVFLSEAQIDDLLEKLSTDEFEHYVAVIAKMELSGKKYKKKTHYQAILDMAAKDRETK